MATSLVTACRGLSDSLLLVSAVSVSISAMEDLSKKRYSKLKRHFVQRLGGKISKVCDKVVISSATCKDQKLIWRLMASAESQ